MKRFIILVTALFAIGMTAFGNCSRGKIINNRTGYFSEIAGYWQPEQELGLLFEIKKIGNDWYYIKYNFQDETYQRYKINYLKNGIFLQSSDFLDGEYYAGYDTKLKSIVNVDKNLCIVGDSGKMNSYIKTIRSKEGYTNVRTGPSKSHKIKKQIPNGTKVLEAEYSLHNQENGNSEWVEVMYFNYDKKIVGEGFVHKNQFK